MITYLKNKTIKPSLKAFPLTWLWLVFIASMLIVADTGSGAVALIIFLLLSPALVMLFATYGRSYVISENLITKINHITGKKESIYINVIGRMQIKPIAFGYGHIIFTLAGGHKMKIKNIKLPVKHELDDFD